MSCRASALSLQPATFPPQDLFPPNIEPLQLTYNLLTTVFSTSSMRLLRRQGDGKFDLVECVGKQVPQYAILSHTWGADHEEVTFKDLTEGTGKSKAGYRKLQFCGQQAARDGLQHFWVDTCCIDKSSSSELTEAINSMFRWYQEAKRCYVYLPDVSVSRKRWNQAFRHSRWFTRGWTLQELIAPRNVEFFTVEGISIGDKKSIAGELSDITGINLQALKGRPVSDFKVDERMSWAAKRETKREEDAAYSLLGIFDIHMPLLYGEGRQKALNRLRKEIREQESSTSPPTSSVGQAANHTRMQIIQKIMSNRDNEAGSQRGERNIVCYKC